MVEEEILSALLDGSDLQLSEASGTSNSIVDEAGNSFMVHNQIEDSLTFRIKEDNGE